MWEPNPLGQPGEFEEVTEAAWHVQGLNALIQVEEVKLLDANGAGVGSLIALSETGAEKPTPEPFAPLNFYPDGSSDSAEIIVSSRDPDDEHRILVRLAGLGGTIRHEFVSLEPQAGVVDDQRQ